MKKFLTLQGAITLSGWRSSARAIAIVGTMVIAGTGFEARAQSTGSLTAGTSGSIENSTMTLYLPSAPSPLAGMGISSFDSYSMDNTLGLRWETIREEGTKGFTVERALADTEGMYEWAEIAYIPGNWDSPVGHFYLFIDKDQNRESLEKGAILYRLKQIGRNGESRYSNPLKVAVSSKSARTSLRHD